MSPKNLQPKADFFQRPTLLVLYFFLHSVQKKQKEHLQISDHPFGYSKKR